MAAARLVASVSWQVLNVRVGTYEGEMWVIHAVVSPEDLPQCPPRLEMEFEGFPVIWSASADPKPEQ